MKRLYQNAVAIALLLVAPSCFGVEIQLQTTDQNGNPRTKDEQGRPLVQQADVFIFRNEELFKNFVNAVSDGGDVMAKYGPAFSAVSKSAGSKVAGLGAAAAIGVVTENPAAAAAGAKVTQVITKKGLDKLMPALGKFIKQGTRFFAGKIQALEIYKDVQNKNTSKFPNPICLQIDKKLKKDTKLSKKPGLSEENPRTLYLAVFNAKKVKDASGKVIVDEHELLWNGHLYPHKDPKTGKYYKGEGNARGGPFAAWVAKPEYITVDVTDDAGKKVGEETRLGIRMIELEKGLGAYNDPVQYRGGITCK